MGDKRYLSNKEAYSIIAKHIFIASYKYNEDPDAVIIFADNAEEAEEKAHKYFGLSDVLIRKLSATKMESVYLDINCSIKKRKQNDKNQ